MHIAVVIQDFHPETGAGPARVAELAAAWIAAGHEVSVVTGLPNRRIPGQRDGIIPQRYRGRAVVRETWQGIRVYRSWLFTSTRRNFATTLVNNLTFAATALLHGLVALPPVDVLIASGPPYFAQFAGVVIARVRGIPLVLEIRDLWPDYLAEMGVIRSSILLRAMFASERWLLRRARSVVVVTDSFHERMVQKGVPRDNVVVIPNGVDIARYHPSADPAPIQELVRRDPHERIVGYLGTFGAGQGLGAVIGAARRLQQIPLAIRFVLVGDGPERAALEGDLKANPVSGVSVHDPIPRDDTRAFYAACDVVLVPHAALPVLGSTVPSKIFEVMACGRPLVAALHGEGERIVRTSGAGVLASPGDPYSLADAIQGILALSSTERDAMGSAGRAFVSTHFNRAALAQRYIELLEGVVRRETPA